MDYKDKKKSPFDPTVYDKLYAELSKQQKEESTEPLWPGLSRPADEFANTPKEEDGGAISQGQVFTEQELEDRLRAYADRLLASANRLASTGVSYDLSDGEMVEKPIEKLRPEPVPSPVAIPEFESRLGKTEELVSAEVKEEPVVEVSAEVKEEPVVEVSAEVKEEPAVEASAEVKEEPVVEASAEVKEEPAVEASAEVEEEPVVEVVAEVKEEPVVEVSAEVKEEPAVEASAEVKEEPVVEVSAEVDNAYTPYMPKTKIKATAPLTIPKKEKPVTARKEGGISAATSTKEPVKIIPMAGTVINKNLKFVNAGPMRTIRITVEEDILVPDIKPDMSSILFTEGSCRIGENLISSGFVDLKEIRVNGTLQVQTLYMRTGEGDKAPIPIDSIIPFKEDVEVNLPAGGELNIKPLLESLDYEIINERKFRIRSVIALNMREYNLKELSFFEGIAGEDLQCMRSPVSYTEMCLRKKETVEIDQDMKLRDGGEIKEILAVRLNVAENHRQIAMDKAVISGTLYCTILYRSYDSEKDTERLENFRDKVEFTQFIQIKNGEIDGLPQGSNLAFRIKDFRIKPKDDDMGVWNSFSLLAEIETDLELYYNREILLVTDLYHPDKDLSYDSRSEEINRHRGSGSVEVMARETLNISENKGGEVSAIFVNGTPKIDRSFIDQGRSQAEGYIDVVVACRSGEKEGYPFVEKIKLPFRASVDIPDAGSHMSPQSEIILKDLWVEKIGGRQMEVNARMQFNTEVLDKENITLIRNPNFLDVEDEGRKASIVLYVARDGDDLWKVAKKYRAPLENIKEVNQLDSKAKIKAGDRIIILR
ncbi:MAG: DUF3794 and LysM peptidoglycan-binding domain-containing protein [Anaerovoracaceae bacterium]|jgi:hypothetical protein